jgi:hypothetical protein
MSELKPIFVVGVPYINLSDREHNDIMNALGAKLEGYHILLHANNGDEITHNLYSVNNVTDIELQELKDLVTETMLNIT